MRYLVTTDRIEIEKGWISKKVDNLDLFRIKDVRFRQSIMDRLLQIGNIVIISTDASSPTLEINGIHKSRELYDKLKEASITADRRRGVVHLES